MPATLPPVKIISIVSCPLPNYRRTRVAHAVAAFDDHRPRKLAGLAVDPEVPRRRSIDPVRRSKDCPRNTPSRRPSARMQPANPHRTAQRCGAFIRSAKKAHGRIASNMSGVYKT